MSANTLDPVLGRAIQLEALPIRPGRQGMVDEAVALTSSLERISAKAERESDPLAQQQLLNVAEALGVMIVSLIAYTRGRVPKVASQAPDVNLIIPS